MTTPGGDGGAFDDGAFEHGTLDDAALLDELRSALHRAGTPTPAMAAAARAAFSWRTVDAELAALAYDSLVDEPAGVRGAAAGARDLVFEGRALSVELEHLPDGLVGQLVPATRGEVTLVRPDGAAEGTAADEWGRFRFAGPVSGPLRLRCTTPSGVLVTRWVRL
ncbi:hypothetical protein [Geodermatophilus marinus]|uniref:hypothetical protein n=1 Tax=Geodermatophilus sp. LHW52908 TaxID=2303986 RepID=UPI000E3D58CE|nr:hypothetical protein [Geodermatophilus sp. LHW52908]RFU21661.1 hypothetical protein D0Z06_10735 [Geodermatophilus sp. LHW52908]